MCAVLLSYTCNVKHDRVMSFSWEKQHYRQIRQLPSKFNDQYVSIILLKLSSCACCSTSCRLALSLKEERSIGIVSKKEFCSDVAPACPSATCTNTSFRKTVNLSGEYQMYPPGGYVTVWDFICWSFTRLRLWFPLHTDWCCPSGEVLTNMCLLHWGCMFDQACFVREALQCDLEASNTFSVLELLPVWKHCCEK